MVSASSNSQHKQEKLHKCPCCAAASIHVVAWGEQTGMLLSMSLQRVQAIARKSSNCNHQHTAPAVPAVRLDLAASLQPRQPPDLHLQLQDDPATTSSNISTNNTVSDNDN
jgi:DNA-binding helix-hairpin-helix protein with protein kinase domain